MRNFDAFRKKRNVSNYDIGSGVLGSRTPRNDGNGGNASGRGRETSPPLLKAEGHGSRFHHLSEPQTLAVNSSPRFGFRAAMIAYPSCP